MSEPTEEIAADPPQEPGADGRFAADYVKGLRDEAAKHRTEARAASERAEKAEADATAIRGEFRTYRLDAALDAAATGRLADAQDARDRLGDTSRFVRADESIDTDAITVALDELLSAKPHLAAPLRLEPGSFDGGAREAAPAGTSWADVLGATE
jgi:hypothetical protein